MIRLFKYLLPLSFIILAIPLRAQVDSTNTITKEQSKRRVRTVAITSVGLYGVSLIGMNELWYKKSEQTGFHFFNDNNQWLQIDKTGHFFTSFHLSRAAVDVWKWAGLPDKKAQLYGSLTGIVFMTPIEILDGFSDDFGASWGDFVANSAGSGLVLGQYLLWDEIRIQPKFSYHNTGFAEQRPNVLGSSFQESLLKDYNGQTYWFSFDVYAFLPETTKFPKWLNVAVGYGGKEMLFATRKDNEAIGLDPYRRYFLSLDLDLMHFKTKSKFLNSVLYVLNVIHLPFPAIEFNRKDGIKGHALYF